MRTWAGSLICCLIICRRWLTRCLQIILCRVDSNYVSANVRLFGGGLNEEFLARVIPVLGQPHDRLLICSGARYFGDEAKVFTTYFDTRIFLELAFLLGSDVGINTITYEAAHVEVLRILIITRLYLVLAAMDSHNHVNNL